MLKAHISRGNAPQLTLRFDVPIQEAIQQLDPMRRWLGWVQGISGVTLQLQAQAITGLTVPLERWQRAVLTHRSHHETFQQRFFGQLHAGIREETGQGLEVNFHQKPFDTTERYWRFILDQGHFFDYVLNRIYWYLAPKEGIVSDFPLHVDIETANTCNMSCPMCYRDRISEVGQMSVELFRKAIDECAAEDVFSVRLSWRGEPLTHPRIRELIAYATARIKNVSFLTNAFYLNDEIIECLVQKRLSYVAVSFDGIGEVYEAIRHPARFEESRQKLVRLRQQRERMGTDFPRVRLCTVWPAIRKDPQAYADAMQPVSDYMVYNPYINFKGPMTLKPDFMCQYPWERMMIAWNGKVQCCTGWNARDIVLGNLSQTSIRTLWHGAQMTKIREVHQNGRRMTLESCALCRHGAQSDPNVEIDTILERRF